MFDEVLIPPAVAAELTAISSRVPPVDLGTLPRTRVVAPRDLGTVSRLQSRLGSGESEAIALAVEAAPAALLIDEAAGRRIAIEYGLTVLGLLGLIIQAKGARHVAAARPLIRRLVDELNFSIDPRLVDRALRDIGE
ncbi:MAG: DUF3368 domain-containing protein [Phycisphaerales bacterium]